MNFLLRVARALIIFLMIFFGLVGVLAGVAVFAAWDRLASGSLVYFGLSFVAGISMAGLGIALLFRRPAAFRWAGFAAAGVLFLNQAIGIWLNTLLCYTPG